MKTSSIIPLDNNARALLLSAVGTIADAFNETLSSSARSPEQRFLLNLETGFFGVAVSAFFYVVRYLKHADPSAFALDLFGSYRIAYVASHKELDAVEEREAISHLLIRLGPPAIEEYVRSLVVAVPSSERIYDPLGDRFRGAIQASRARLEPIVSLLLSRLQNGGGLTFPEATHKRLRTKAEIDFQALIDSYVHFFG